MISDKKIEEIKQQMEQLGLKECELQEKFILGSGRGGQNLQKTHSTVQLTHIASGIQVRVGQSRQREENRWLARRLLCEKLFENLHPDKSPKNLKREKIRKQKKKSQKRSLQKHNSKNDQSVDNQ